MTLVRKQARRLPPSGGTPRESAEAINNIFNGRIDAAGEVTLTDSADTTAISDTRITTNSAVVLMPMTANASAEYANGTIYIGTYSEGSATISHANNAQTDRTFRFLVLT